MEAEEDTMIRQEPHAVVLQGMLEQSYPNGISVLRLGPGTATFRATGEPYRPGRFVRLYATNVLLYNTNV